MAKKVTCNWDGTRFNVYEMEGGTWKDLAGIYIFAGKNRNDRWQAKYIGQTSSFEERMTPSHKKWSPAIRHGATHVHTVAVVDEDERLRLEADLIETFQPPLNEQGK